MFLIPEGSMKKTWVDCWIYSTESALKGFVETYEANSYKFVGWEFVYIAFETEWECEELW